MNVRLTKESIVQLMIELGASLTCGFSVDQTKQVKNGKVGAPLDHYFIDEGW
jgi:hypothetical protein